VKNPHILTVRTARQPLFKGQKQQHVTTTAKLLPVVSELVIMLSVNVKQL
jgi:hypothetical protein